MTPRCHCKIENNRILFCRLHEAANGLYSAVEYVRRMLPTFKPAEGVNGMAPNVKTNFVQGIIPYDL
jgi:hypothetical protein